MSAVFEDGLGSDDFVSDYSYHMSVIKAAIGTIYQLFMLVLVLI
jgi:hypothetical protein